MRRQRETARRKANEPSSDPMLRCPAIMRRFMIAAAVVVCAEFLVAGQPLPANRVLTHREQAPLQYRWITNRFQTVLPVLMRRAGFDMWIVVSREYNDDPVFRSMSPATTYSSRRRTILVFFNPGGGKPVERLSIG